MNESTPRTRVAIPLHRSGPWVDNVAANIRRLAGHAAITISDATGEDDALPLLQVELASVPGLEWLGRRSIAPGWVSHCNDLLERSTEEFFAWLPHDDEIDADWVLEAASSLDRHPTAVLALGMVVPVHEAGVTDGGYPIEPSSAFGALEADVRIRDALDVCLHGDTSLLGACFRGVQRRDRAAPLPMTPGEGEWSDILWALRMLTHGPFTTMPATYGKRWHPGGAHRAWGDARRWPDFRTRWLPEALGDLGAAERESFLTSAWSAEVVALEQRIANERSRGEATLRSTFESSRSWRITAPLRRLASSLRRR
jgi:hypothetical protein